MNLESDISLLHRYAASRDADAFAAITRRYAPMVFAVARRVTGSAHDAEDIAQACFLELARRAGDVRTSLAGWLHAIAVSRAKNFLRDGAVRAKHERATESAQAGQSANSDWDELSPMIDRAIDELPEDLRLPVVMHYLHDRGQAEIAAELGLSQPTVSRRIRDGIAQLRTKLHQAGLASAAVGIMDLLPRASSQAAAVPATLKASLGKIAIAGIGAPAIGARALAGKWIAAGVAAAVAMSVTTWLLVREPAVATNPAANILHNANGVLIDRVPQLVWGTDNSGQRSMLGALAAASNATDRPIDYTNLAGESSLAFLVRWHPVGQREQNTYLAVHSLDDEARTAVEAALGYRLQAVGDFGRTKTPVATKLVARHVRAGWPVIVEERGDRDFAVVVGVDHAGEDGVVFEYNRGAEEVPLNDLGGGVVLFGSPLAKLAERESFRQSILRTVSWWDRKQSTPPGLLYGDAAYRAWLAEYDRLSSMNETQQHVVWRESWWNYDILCDGFHHGAIYLRRHANVFPAARAELLAAADELASLEQQGLVDSVYRKSSGPWTEKTFEQFMATGLQQQAAIEGLHRVHAAAIERLRAAARLMH